jgi:hypothetical protein
MAKHYGKASQDVLDRIEKLRDKYHPEIDAATLDVLFVFGDEAGHTLEHQGYPALAVVKVNGLKERAAGLADALLVVDRYSYSGLTQAQMDAMLDHELYHLEPVIDDKTEIPKLDSLGRLKLAIRKHDRQFGWFDEIAQRHGEDSIEVMQATHMLTEARQLYFNFADEQSEAA